MKLQEVVASSKLLVCVGSGGVGKTTLAASISLRAAEEGRKVLVLTIDPARRLANALGLKRFGNEETRIELPGVSGELWAMMLDTRHTFDDLICRVSPTEQTRDRILANELYRNIADSLAGAHEYMATEVLYDVVQTGRYDLVVLDTPPVKNALDFLDAPGRLARFLDKRIMKWFLTPYDEGKVFGRLMMGTSAVVFRLLGYIFGKEFLQELSEFFFEFRELYDGFRQRHEAVVDMFSSNETSFLVICAPAEPSMEVASFFVDELYVRRMPGAGVIVNQVHVTSGQPLDARALLGEVALDRSQGLAAHTVASLLARLGSAHRRLVELARIERGLIEQVVDLVPEEQSVWLVPRLESEVHDLHSLRAVGEHLFGAAAIR